MKYRKAGETSLNGGWENVLTRGNGLVPLYELEFYLETHQGKQHTLMPELTAREEVCGLSAGSWEPAPSWRHPGTLLGDVGRSRGEGVLYEPCLPSIQGKSPP